MFIALTQHNGDRFYMNVNHILRITSHGGPSTIKTVDNELTLVEERIEDIAKILAVVTPDNSAG